MSEAGEKPRAEPLSSGSRWALQVGSVLGIPIRIHATFLLILVWYGMAAAAKSQNVPRELASVLALFACVVLHELGHAAMALRFGVRTREIVLYPIGGVARLDRMPGGWAELLIALAGPAVNVVLAGGCVAALAALDVPQPFRQAMPWQNTGLVQQLLWVNVTLVVFNMIPAFQIGRAHV